MAQTRFFEPDFPITDLYTVYIEQNEHFGCAGINTTWQTQKLEHQSKLIDQTLIK